MKVGLASRNENKLRELRAALPGWTLDLLTTDMYPPEEGDSYAANARSKARHGRLVAPPDSWVIGEDSGLEVAGIGGRPGVHSARYADHGTDPVAKLLRELVDVSGAGRRARYVCELVSVSPERIEYRESGVLEGTIADEARGSAGFGYDPVFVPAGEKETVAELGNDWKTANSHRARAAADLQAVIESGQRAPEN